MQGFITQATEVSDIDNLNRLLWQFNNALPAGHEGVVRFNETTRELYRDNGINWVKLFGSNEANNVPSLRIIGAGGVAPHNHTH